MRLPRIMILALLVPACGGTTCAGLEPVPGGFLADDRLIRGVQLRLGRSGLDALQSDLSALVADFAPQTCSATTAVPCPVGFAGPAGRSVDSVCDALREVCVDVGTGQNAPVVGVELAAATFVGVDVCRDPITDPQRRACYAWLRVESGTLTPEAPRSLRADLSVQIRTSPIPVRVAALDLDCLLTVDTAATAPDVEPVALALELAEWSGSAGVVGQLDLRTRSVTASLSLADLQIAADPVYADAFDVEQCTAANLALLAPTVLPRFIDTLENEIQAAVDDLLTERCGVCPAGSTCVSQRCETPSGARLPRRIGLEGRTVLNDLFGDLIQSGGAVDLSVLAGGPSAAAATSVVVGTLAGARPQPPTGPACAAVGPDPQTQPTFAPPTLLDLADEADLDFDGQRETPYMAALGVSEALVGQLGWAIHGSSALCLDVTSDAIELLNTGALGLVMPSLRILTRADLDPRAVYPVRVTLSPSTPPRVRIGSGQVDRSTAPVTVVDPLVRLSFDDAPVNIYAVIDDRWVRLVQAVVDLRLDAGLEVAGSDSLVVVLDDGPGVVENVRILDRGPLAESSAELATAIPVLAQLALPAALGSLPDIEIPAPSDLAGFSLQVVGVRGVGGAGPDFEHAALFFDLSRPLRLPSADQSADPMPLLVGEPRLITTAAGDRRLEVDVAALDGGPVEVQYRLHGGPWTPFAAKVAIEDDRLRVQGRHRLSLRARRPGRPETLDPTPTEIDVTIDDEAPEVRVVWRGPTEIAVDAFDVVSGDRLSFSVEDVDGRATPVQPDLRGRIAVPSEGGARLVIADKVGHRTVVPLNPLAPVTPQTRVAPEAGGCRCAPRSSRPAIGWLGVVLLFTACRRRWVFGQGGARRPRS